ncbi:MAG: HTTM domain-containing protein, partial [Leifsonia sp.]
MTASAPKPSILRRVQNVASAIVRDVPAAIAAMLHAFVSWFEGWLLDSKKATYGIAVARIGLSTAALGILVSNFSTRLYTWGAGGAWSGDIASPRSDFPQIWIFSAFQAVRESAVGFTVLYLLVGVLAVLLLVGYRVRIVMPAFLIMWISLIELQRMIGDQGDNMFRIALIALLFTDAGKRWSLDARRRKNASEDGAIIVRAWAGSRILPAWLTNLSHNLAVIVLACQICMVYVAGALFKAGGVPWQNGYAIYAPLHTQRFGTWPELSTFVTTWGPAVAVLTIGSVLFQVIFAGALLNKWTRRMVLLAMLSFHAGIGLLMGLPWFSLIMVSVDGIFIRDVTWAGLANWFGRKSRESEDRPVGAAKYRRTAVAEGDLPEDDAS